MIMTMVAAAVRTEFGRSCHAFGIAPPRPRPVKNRITSRVLTYAYERVASCRCEPSVEKNDLLAPDAVCQRPRSRADHQPEQPAENTDPVRPCQPIPCQAGAHSRSPGIETSRNSTAAAGQQQPSGTPDRLLLDKRGDIDRDAPPCV